ncbi:MAG: hypothetical protein WA738_11640 [Candidatus Angelobacter sp.]
MMAILLFFAAVLASAIASLAGFGIGSILGLGLRAIAEGFAAMGTARQRPSAVRLCHL